MRVDDNRNNCIVLDTQPESKYFSYDWVASRSSSQEDMFKQIGLPMIDTCLEGTNLHYRRVRSI